MAVLVRHSFGLTGRARCRPAGTPRPTNVARAWSFMDAPGRRTDMPALATWIRGPARRAASRPAGVAERPTVAAERASPRAMAERESRHCGGRQGGYRAENQHEGGQPGGTGGPRRGPVARPARARPRPRPVRRNRTAAPLLVGLSTGLPAGQPASPAGARWGLPAGWVISARPAHLALVSEADFITAQSIQTPRGALSRRTAVTCRRGCCAARSAGADWRVKQAGRCGRLDGVAS